MKPLGAPQKVPDLSWNNDQQGSFIMATQSTRDHLIDIGVELMHKHGYNATGLNEVLAAADVPKGSFYHHFASKEDFASAALDRYFTRAAEHCATFLGNTKASPLRRLKRYFTDLVRVFGQTGPIPGCLMGRMSLEIAPSSPALQQQLGLSFNRWQDSIAAALQEAIDKKELPARTDAHTLAGFLINSWQGALVRSHAEHSNAPLQSFMHYTFNVLLRG